MSLIKYLNHRKKFFASVLPSILPCAQISSEVRVKVFSDKTSLNGKIYASPIVAPPESPLLVLMPPLPPHRIEIVIRRLPTFLDAARKSATEALVAAEVPSRSIHTMKWILTTRYRGRRKMPLPLILPPLTSLLLTLLTLTPPPLLSRRGSH